MSRILPPTAAPALHSEPGTASERAPDPSAAGEARKVASISGRRNSGSIQSSFSLMNEEQEAVGLDRQRYKKIPQRISIVTFLIC